MKSYGEVFKELRTQRNMSQKDVADTLTSWGLDVNNAHVSRWENDSNRPSLEHFIALCRLFGIRNVHEVFGDGPMMGLTKDLNKEGVRRLVEFREILLHNPQYTADNDFGRTDLESDDAYPEAVLMHAFEPVPIPAPTDSTDEARMLPSYRLWHKDPLAASHFEPVEIDATVPESAKFAVVVNGDAMLPHLQHGRRVWIEYLDRPHPGDILLVQLNKMLYLRVYQLTDDGRIMLMPTNPAYEPFHVTEDDDLRILGRVVPVDDAQGGASGGEEPQDK